MDGREVGQRLLDWLEYEEKTQTELRDETGLSPTTISNLVNGHLQRSNARTVRRLAEAFGISVEVFMEGPATPKAGTRDRLRLAILQRAQSNRESFKRLAIGSRSGNLPLDKFPDSTLHGGVKEVLNFLRENGLSPKRVELVREAVDEVLGELDPEMLREMEVDRERYREALERLVTREVITTHSALERYDRFALAA
jgi:transcriptional regulator with XRE-family HTH domain